MSGSFPAGVPKGKGGAGHTVLAQAGLVEPQEILPAVERQQKAATQLPTKIPQQGQPAQAVSWAHSRADRASALTRAPGSSPWRWHMGNDPFTVEVLA